MPVELHVASRLKKLLPPLTTDEYKQLETNILADGEIRETIYYWNDGRRNNIVDGMHRFKIAEKHSLPYKTKELKLGDTYDDAELWMLNHQLGRRNLLKPQDVRRIRGELYNRLKKTPIKQGRAPSGQFDTSGGDSAESVGKKAGVSPSTVKRDGARVEALKQCAKAVQKGDRSGTIKLTDAEIKKLSKIPEGDQSTIVTAMRKGRAKNVQQAMKLEGIKGPPKPAKKTPQRKLDRGGYYKQWEKSLGPVLRLVEKIADGVSEKRGVGHRAVRKHMDAATDEMVKWMRVKK